ncbi:MAG: sodium-translocating pyrophosphatase, partial [Actinobacteria bacterium]|nr:sodium-translocating pyrophosphatase [Actinomycetota bacterium]
MSLFSAADTAALALTEENRVTVIAIGVIAVVALLVALVLVREVLSAGQGSAKMREISAAVQEGAAAYLNRQFKTLVVFGILASILLWVLPANTTNERVGRAIFFVVGALFSGLTGYLGMWLAVRANTRVAAAAQTSGEIPAMRIAFRSGGVAGMVTVGLGLLGAAIVVLVYAGEAPRVLEGFGFGAALLAMFMRVGGGIFTKAADVGA